MNPDNAESTEIPRNLVRIGVLLDRSVHEQWVVESIRNALAAPDVKLVAVARTAGDELTSFTERTYGLVDRVVEPARRQQSVLFTPVDVVAEFAVRPVPIEIVRGKGGWYPDDVSVATLRGCNVDVWLCFAGSVPRRPLASISSLGVWGLEIGEGVPAINTWAGAAEIAAGSAVTMVRVVDYASPGAAVLYRSFGATVRDSARRNRLQALRKGVTFSKRLLERLTRNRETEGCSRQGSLDMTAQHPAQPGPTLSRLVAYSTRVLWSRIANRLPSLRSTCQWQIGYHFTDQSETGCQFERLQYLVPPRDRFWADPFAVEHQHRHFIFLEELSYRTQKGRLAVIEVFENGEAGEEQVVLERPYHLSYPFTFSWEGSLYMLPETAGNRTIEVYRCEEFPHQWRLHKVLLDNIDAFDATLWQQDDRWWMFVNVAEPGADCNDELHLYWSASPFGPWTVHPRNPVISDVRSARMAGPLVWHQGKLHRPSQDCSLAYGHSVVINRIDILTDDDYQETAIGRISPGWREDVLRVHTYGGTKRLRVIDCLVRRWRWQ